MENQPKQQRTIVSNEELAKLLNEGQGSNTTRYVNVKPNTVMELEFTSAIYKTTNQFGNEVFEFELTDLVSEGEGKGTNKVLTLSAKNPITRELLNSIAHGQLKAKIMRAGEGKSSRYSIMKS